MEDYIKVGELKQFIYDLIKKDKAEKDYDELKENLCSQSQ